MLSFPTLFSQEFTKKLSINDNQDISLLIYCEDFEKDDIKDVFFKCLMSDSDKPINSDILYENIFFQNATLNNNLLFYSRLSNINLMSFLSDLDLKEIFNKNKYKKTLDIKAISRSMEILIYMYCNKLSIINSVSFFNFIEDKMNKKMLMSTKNFLHSNNIIFCTYSKDFSKANKYFNNYVLINKGEYKIFNNFESFKEKVHDKT